MIVAGPGSGKTTTLTLKIAYLIREGLAKPENILAITFTQKAAKEISDRTAKLQSWGEGTPTITTFHGLAYKMLRDQGAVVGLVNDWQVLGGAEQKKLATEVLKKHPEGEWSARDFLLALTRWKGDPTVAEAEVSEPLRIVFDEYQATLRDRNQLDFDDLLLCAQKLLHDHPKVQTTYAERFTRILVDEYQDTNLIQAAILDLLAVSHRQLTIIGDPDQAIYAFRGAHIENFIHFKSTYPEATEIHLAENYRCPKRVAEASQALIQHNVRQLTKLNIPIAQDDRRIQSVHADTSWQEAKGVIETLEALVGGSDHLSVETRKTNDEEAAYSWADVAILYRTHGLGDQMAKALEEAGIPFQRVGGITFFERKEIREFLEAVHAMHSGDQAITFPNEKLSQHLRRLIEQMGLKAKYDDGTSSGGSRYDRLLELLNFSTLYDSLLLREAFEAFYAYALLARSEDQWDDRRDAVSLMSVHAAKGLEFPVVFMVGLEEGIFPYLKYMRSTESSDQIGGDASPYIEEERRLFYVGMTRARERLYLSCAKERVLYGETVTAKPSRFLSEIPLDFMSVSYREARKPRKIKLEEPSPQMELF